MGIRIEGLDQLEARLKKSGAGAAKDLAKALTVEAGLILTAAIRITPVDLGPLWTSGHVQTPTIRKTRAEVVLGFGGAASDYALYQHEVTTLKHKGQGQAGYLRKPVLAAKSGFGARLARHLDLF